MKKRIYIKNTNLYFDIGTTTIKDSDTIILTFDLNLFDIYECQKIFSLIAQNFPKNNVITKFKGVDMKIIGDKK